MEARIQYCTTSDGVSIAYWSLGEGTPLVIMPNLPMSHVELEWQIPEYRSWYESLLRNYRLIRYDGRGSGLSDRLHVSDYSLDAHVRDLQAVFDATGLGSAALLAPLLVGPVAISFAARKPDRVSHLALWCSFARAADYASQPVVQTISTIRDKDWVTYTETVAHSALGWEGGEPVRRYAAMMRECVTQEAAQAMFAAVYNLDASDLLPQVKCPTLVLHRRQSTFMGMELSRSLAASIPGARLVVLEGSSLAPWIGDSGAVVRALDEFLSEDGEQIRLKHPLAGAVHTILFTDVEGSTALTQRLGDLGARAVLREHERITRDVLKKHGGAEVKTMGDGFMASFGSVTKAVECAIALQRAFNEREGEQLSVRVGLNAGEPIEEDGDLFGATVILASRIAAKAAGGEILVADNVRSLSAGKGFLFADRGEFVAKGFEEPVRVYEVHWRE